ncbi:SusE domain-containing protein [Marinilabilia salmonicolor]|uniref:SusE domain-containing protein n=1 Tax=Marinilabilia salmonicolor TaxID=989 RepID=UPI00029A8C44|nr:SusE domain-containing protein [Marinilabilia salmonicolor]
MKKLLIFGLFLTAIWACEDDFSLNTDFNAPTDLYSPESVNIDLSSGEMIELSWTGGGAEDGSTVIYQVLFDEEGGDFSAPLDTLLSDLGAKAQLSLTHTQLNTLARRSGIVPESTGKLIWTVLTSKGGVVQKSDMVKEISITRPEGIDNFPEQLFLYGNATENDGNGGLPFRKAEDGVFVIYTEVPVSGEVFFTSATSGDSFTYYAGSDGKLAEGTGGFGVDANADPYRITVDFNSLSVRTEVISDVRAIWGATYDVIGSLEYIGNGVFQAENCDIVFIDQSRPETNPPSWLGWTEERYYFIANVDGNDLCWGRNDGISPERPTGGEPLSFYEIGEFAWSQWDHLWKMSGDLDYTSATITIDTNIEGIMAHQFSDIVPLN